MDKLTWGIIGCEELERYFLEIGIASGSRVPYNSALVCNNMKFGGGSRINYYFLEKGKWNFKEGAPKIEVSFSEYLENKEHYNKLSHE